ncbi:MAG: serine O-acetyltransferase, partial [Methylovirgula sp.]
MILGNTPLARRPSLDRADSLFARVRIEAEEILRREPCIAGWVSMTILDQPSLEAAIIHRLAERLGNDAVAAEFIRQTYLDMVGREPTIGIAFRAD